MPSLVALLMLVTTGVMAAETVPTGSFAFSFEVALPGTCEEMYDALTGDISGWWDHSMSGDPWRLVIEPQPGGRFLELFDESGDGCVHATVTYAERGKLLRMVGPLGLAGHAIDMVTTWTLTPAEQGCRLEVQVRAAGEVHEGWPGIVEQTWHHFIEDRFVPYVEAGKHR
jgi:hypothetical protein